MTINPLDPTHIEVQLISDLRELVLRRLHDDPQQVDLLAQRLDVSEASIRSLMTKPRWDSDLALRAAALLRLDVHVASGR